MRLWSLVIAILVCFGAGAIGTVFTANSSGAYYQELVKPQWAPPGWVFGPVWTILYVMMGFSLWLVWSEKGSSELPVKTALWIFGVHLALNAAWTAVFFGLKLPGWAFVEIIALLLMIGATMIAFLRVRPLATILLIPYGCWVTFAACLNYSLWSLNR